MPGVVGPALHDASASHDVETITRRVLKKVENDQYQDKTRMKNSKAEHTASGRNLPGLSISR